MPLFSYKAADSSGKIVKGSLDARDESEIVGQLQDMGCIPIRIMSVQKSRPGSFFSLPGSISSLIPSLNRIPTKDIMLFTQDLSTLLGAGLPVDRTLAILKNVTERPVLKEIISDILKDVQGGSDLSEALLKHPRAFSKFYVNMVRAGESGGVLEPVLERLGVFLETSHDLKEYIISSMVYPLFLVFVGGISIIIMLTFVIPKFSIIFSDMGQAMPLSTQLLLGFSGILRDYWWVMAGALGLTWFFTVRYLKTPVGRLRVDRYLIEAPFIGRLIVMVAVARFARNLGTLTRSGVPILQALKLVKEIVGNKVIVEKLAQAYEMVKEGERLSRPLAESNMFPSLAIQMISVGEETGKLDVMLLRVAENYEKAVKNMIKRFISFLEPAMILAMGLVVGFIVISMLMAVFSMNELPF
jgi:general secretion pathway protein F